MSTLMSKSLSFTGLDQCWALDNYDGGVDLNQFYYPITPFTTADLPTVEDNPTADEYRKK
jgi:hypothetical protein